MDPCWTRDAGVFAYKLNGGGTEGGPTACIVGFLFWMDERLAHQVESDPFCVIIPGAGKIARGGPGQGSSPDTYQQMPMLWFRQLQAWWVVLLASCPRMPWL